MDIYIYRSNDEEDDLSIKSNESEMYSCKSLTQSQIDSNRSKNDRQCNGRK